MKDERTCKEKVRGILRHFYKQLLVAELLMMQWIGKPAYAAAFAPPQNVLDGVQWVVLACQFAVIAFAAVQLGPIAIAFMRKNQQKVEEGKDHAVNVAIGIAIAFVGLWFLKMYVETLGGTYPLPF